MDHLVLGLFAAAMISFGIVCYWNNEDIRELRKQNTLLVESVKLLHKELKYTVIKEKR